MLNIQKNKQRTLMEIQKLGIFNDTNFGELESKNEEQQKKADKKKEEPRKKSKKRN